MIDKTKTRVSEFASLADLYRDCSPHASRKDSPRFRGATLDEIRERRFAWPEAIAEMQRLAQVIPAPVKQCRFVKKWNDYDGDELDIERLHNGQDPLSRRIKERGGHTRGQVRKIVINVAESADVPAAAMYCKAYAAGKLCDGIEESGDRAEIYIAAYAAGAFDRGREDFYTSVKIKSAEEPLNIGAVLAASAPWMLRFWFFAVMDKAGNNGDHVTSSRGSARGIKHLHEDATVIDTGEALTMAEAGKWIEKHNATK